jgi:hypothetical protein
MRLLVLLLVPATADSAESSSEAFLPRPAAGHAAFEMRAGLATVGPLDRPVICADVRPIERLSFEMCGNGAGFLHQAPVADMAHFRARGLFAQRDEGRWQALFFAGAGLAEVQNTADRPGFVIRDPGAPAVEAAGPEVSLSAQGRAWVQERVYSVAEFNVGAAYIPGAPAVLGRGGRAVPFAQLTVGMGF